VVGIAVTGYDPPVRSVVTIKSSQYHPNPQRSAKRNFTYHLKFLAPGLKNFEKTLAMLEAETILQGKLSLNNSHVVLKSTRLFDIKTLQRMTAFGKIRIHFNSHDNEFITHQFLLENYNYTMNDHSNKDSSKTEPKRRRNYLLHDFHPYKGRFYPQMIKPLINCYCKPRDTILDPFCGSGTTLVEASLMGIGSIGIDLNPIALFITKVKMQSLYMSYKDTIVKCERLLKVLKRRIMLLRKDYSRYSHIIDKDSESLHDFLDNIPNKEAWFNPGVLEELFAIRSAIEECEIPEIRDFMLLALSAIVKDVSNWDTSSLRQRLLKVPKRNVKTFESFQEKLGANLQLLRSFEIIRRKIDPIKVNYSIVNGDSRNLDSLEDCSVNAIITSPPYSTSASLPYIETDKLSMYVLGLLTARSRSGLKSSIIGERDISENQRLKLEEEFIANYQDIQIPPHMKLIIKNLLFENQKHNVGFRRRNLASTLYRYFNDMQQCIGEMNRVIRLGGTLCLVTGDSYTKVGGTKKVLIPTTKTIREMTEAAGFKLSKIIAMTPTQNILILRA
jgi:DNA modification methylase